MGYSIEATEDGCYPGTTVLVNKLGIRDQKELDRAERILVALHAVEIEQNPPTAPFDLALYCDLHKRLFGDLYDWAGELRRIYLS